MRRRLFFLGGLLLLFTLVNAAIFFFTRSGTSKTDKVIIQAMEESIKESNKTIQSATEKIIFDFEEMTMDPYSNVKVNYWKPKAEIICSFTRIMYDYIETKKNKKAISNDDINDIYKYLLEHKKDILDRDSLIANALVNHFSFINKPMFILCNDTVSPKKYLRNGISQASVRLLLTLLQNELKRVENKTVAFCKLQVGRIIEEYTMSSAIIGQNSTFLKPGDYLEIFAGIGSFSNKSLPEVFINNKKVQLNHDALSVYEMKTPKKAGSYSVPVLINYLDQDGIRQTISKDVAYTVAKECDQ